MMSSARYWAIVPAAGIGTRMQAIEPKQYIRLLGKSLLEHSIERLLAVPVIEGIVVVVHPDDTQWRSLRIAHHPQVYSVEGGNERCDSVLNGLDFLVDQLSPEDFVLVHDAARPCIQIRDIENLIAATQDHPLGGILGVPASDTIKRVNSGVISATVDRRELWQALTPQCFRLGALRVALRDGLQNNCIITDESSAIEMAGGQPLIVEGRRDNLKVTYPADLTIANLILRYQQDHQLFE